MRNNVLTNYLPRSDLDSLAAGPAASGLRILPVVQKERRADPYTFYRADRHDEYTFLHLRSQWQAAGDSLLVTVLQGVGAKDEGDPVAEFARTADGFHAVLKSGAKVSCAARLLAPTPASPAGLFSYLTVSDAGGAESGIVLGSTQPGKPADFEFSSSVSPKPRTPNPAPQPSTIPIYAPLRDLSIAPERSLFVDSVAVTIVSPDADAEVHYTLDGTDPTLLSPLCREPVKLTGSAMVKARAFRNGLNAMPADRTSGTLMGRVHTAVFTREEPLAADTVAAEKLKPGLAFRYYAGKWPCLLFGAPTLKPAKTGETAALFDTAANVDNPGAFGFLYEGYVQVPEDGVYTIYAPDEFMKFRPLAGYDLTVWLGRQVTYANGVPKSGSVLNEWYPATRRHAFGTWSVALRKGFHPLRVYYADFRPGAVLEYMQFTYPGLNVPGLSKTFFDGPVPQLTMAGPGLDRQPIPAAWLRH